MQTNYHSKFVETIKILIWHSQLNNLIVFNCNNTKFSLSIVRSGISICVATLYFSMSIFCLYNVILYKRSSVVVIICNSLLIIFSSIYLFTTWVWSILKQNNYIELLNELIKFDEKLELTITKLNYKLIRKNLEKRFVIRYIIVIMWILVEICYLSFFNIDINFYAEIGKCVKYVLNSSICFQCMEIVNLINVRFVALNTNLYSLIVKGRRKILDYPTLCEICSLHHHLSKLVKLFNKTFGLILLLMFAMSFLNIVMIFFFLSVEFQSSIINLFRVIYNTISSAGFIIDTIYICNCCYSTIEEVLFQNVKYLKSILSFVEKKNWRVYSSN